MTKINDPLARSQQTREIINKLRADILLGKYPNGTRLIETKIADELGTSRAPVRTAFQLLAQEGLVINLANGGTEIVGFSIKNAIDLFDLRLLLEQKALEMILNNKSFNFRPLLDVVDKMQSILDKPANTEFPISETYMLDIDFHRSILILSNNNPILVAWNTMTNIFQALLEITNMTYFSSHTDFLERHIMLAELIIRRDPTSITELNAHILNSKEIIIERLNTRL